MNNTLTLGFSPCPNDTFIFDALVNGRIDTGAFRFDVHLEDVETLNRWALEGRLDITKLSFPALFQASAHYQLLSSGSALGKGVGPLLVSKQEADWTTAEIEAASIAIPGVHTTANLLLGYAFPGATNKSPVIFSSIEDAVLDGAYDLGVLIHENRFTYQQKGLHKVMDLGEYWETHTGVPIPLGGIAIRKKLGRETADTITGLIRQSLAYAYTQYPAVTDYVRQHAQAMDETVMRKHIDLYVNNFTVDLGDVGMEAVHKLEQVYLQSPDIRQG